MLGSALKVIPPYTYLIQGLTIGTKYYVRVAARNSISLLTPITQNSDPTKWSQVVSAITTNQKPSAPVSVTAQVSSPTSLQILITPPTSNGGIAISNYLIEWDSSKFFDDAATYGSANPAASSLPVLKSDSGILVYELTGLQSRVSYWVRVSARNSIGTGPITIISSSITPAGKPGNPQSISLTSASSQPTPISTINVSWTPPAFDGGSAVTGYLVEWWEGGPVYEVQLVQLTTPNFPQFVNGQYLLSFAPTTSIRENTGTLSFNSSAYNVRSELMNLGYINGLSGNFTFDFTIGNVEVEKSVIPQKGYQWTVTFLSEQNYGNQVMLQATSMAAPSTGEAVNVYELVSGSRPGGFSEIQIIQILAGGTTLETDLGGWFRLSFQGAESLTPFLPVTASPDQVTQALNQLTTIRSVQVSRSTIHTVDGGISYAGYEWTVTFTGNVGNQPAIQIDPLYLTSAHGGLSVGVFDGNNSLSQQGLKLADTFPGEAPKNYKSALVSPDSLAYSITGLVPGNTYYVAVSAVNNLGIGNSMKAQNPTTLKKQVPQPPVNVSIDVNPGSSSSLLVNYSPPQSDGGSQILSYRVELDTTPKFLNPIHTSIPCASANIHSVYQITTSGFVGDPITSGYFSLTLTRNRATFVTDFIPYDAPASLSDEVGVLSQIAGLTATTQNSLRVVVASTDVSQKIFVNDLLQFDNQRFSQEIFSVVSVNKTQITLDKTLFLVSPGSASSNIYRIVGGRGLVSNSRVACTADSVLCPSGRRAISGSMESKFEMIPEALSVGVNVDRTSPDLYNGVTWRVTFLDNSYPGALNFKLAVTPGSNQLKTLKGNTANIDVIELVSGQSYSQCAGQFVVPNGVTLSSGQPYYARVFAYNDIGYSLPQVAPSPQKPQVVPGPPTSVTLSVVSETELRVIFNGPMDEGGDSITSYRIDYSLNSDFTNSYSVYVTYVDGGAPFFKTLSGLTTGQFYYVRVSAGNSQGYGASTPSVPPSLNPYKSSSAPTNAQLFVTSNTMLTVTFNLPVDNGGDAITKYRVEWDINSQFNSIQSLPNKGYVDLDATMYNSYTITSLIAGQVYYARVFAVNSAGLGTPAITTPPSVSPALTVPGKPQTVFASTGLSSGQLFVSWQRPTIPAHGYPCSGLANSPNPCPSTVAGGLPTTDGGSAITEYQINYNDLSDFSGMDNGAFTTTNTYYTLNNLTPGRKYFIRVLARNAQGAGSYCQFSETNCLVVYNQVSAVSGN